VAKETKTLATALLLKAEMLVAQLHLAMAMTSMTKKIAWPSCAHKRRKMQLSLVLETVAKAAHLKTKAMAVAALDAAVADATTTIVIGMLADVVAVASLVVVTKVRAAKDKTEMTIVTADLVLLVNLVDAARNLATALKGAVRVIRAQAIAAVAVMIAAADLIPVVVAAAPAILRSRQYKPVFL
jgi:hypothetical protein